MISYKLSVISDRLSGRSAGSGRYVWLLLFLISSFVVSLSAATFDEQRKAVSASLATQPESAIMSLVKSGLDEGKAVLAVADAQKWLRNNQPNDPLLLYYAGRAAELSGDWKGAVALYQQYLAKADLKSATADEAVYATYILLLERLKNDNGAYAFGRNDGNRLLVCPRARQFDQWFLDQAIARNDATAVAERLSACIAAGLPSDLLNSRYSHYFRWLLNSIDGFMDHRLPVTQDLYDGVRDLCEVITHDEEMKLRLDWAVSVKAYNVAKLGDKTKQQVVRRPLGKVKGLNSATDKKVPKKVADAKTATAQAVEEKKLELGDDVTPPIAEASALLEKYPRYVLWVMTGWAGGGNGPYYRGDFKKYWPHEAEAKMAPILAALSKLTPAEAAAFLNAAAYGGYVGSPGILELKSVQDYLNANQAVMNFRNSVFILGKEWNQLTPEEAQKLSPQLAQTANPQASLVRAIAAGGKDYDKVMASLLGPEVWRLGPGELNGPWADQLWHYCGKPGGNQKRDEQIAKARAAAASFATSDPKKEDPADKRIAAFRNLWTDYKSAQPKIPAARARAEAILKFSPELVPELLKDQSPDVQSMVRDAIAAGLEDAKGLLERDGRVRGIPHWGYAPWIQRLADCQNGMVRMKQERKDLYAPHPLEAALRAAVAERLAQGKIEPWLTMVWINMQFPEDNAEQIKLMQALYKSPLWTGVPFEVQFAAREWFKKDAMTAGQIAWVDAGSAKLICKDLLALSKETDAATAAAALSKVIDGSVKSPVKIDIQGMDKLAEVSEEVFRDSKVIDLVLEVVDGLRHNEAGENERAPFANRLCDYVSKQRDPVLIHRTAACMWGYAGRNPRGGIYNNKLKPLVQSLIEESPAAASALARTGVDTLNHSRSLYGFNPAQFVPEMQSLLGKAAMKLGLVTIPVAQTDPSYPVYKSQSDWLIGNEDSAWTLCSESWAQLLPVHREMSVDYLMWALQRTINSRDEARQEELIKAMMTWAGEPNSMLTTSQKADIEIAYGDIAIQRGQLKQAGEIYLRTMQNAAYSNTTSRSTAALRRVTVQRIEKDYDAALQTLAELEMERVPEMWAPLRYARAEVFFDKTEYDNASEDIESILSRDQAHSEAKIMQGKLMLKRQRLMEATEVELGSTDAKQTMVPGEALKVTLTDPTLEVSGIGSEIEVAIWAESGDKEHVLLRQFGDQKTKFRGEIATALGAPKPDDRTLQVIGDDKIFYAYSERFRKKMNNMEEKRGGPITVASDALLMASARKLLSEAEQRVADMQAKMDALKSGGSSVSSARAVAEAGRAAASAGTKGESISDEPDQLELEARQKRLAEERLKPGNPVYVRVIDPDRGRTAGIDELSVSVESSSGDAIGQVVLKETGTHTGWFEGSVPTAGGTPKAFAADSEPGRNPNMVISPLTTYPAWRPVVQSGKAPEFKIDFNDNVALGEMTITAKEAGAKLKKFAVYAGMNPKEMISVAAFPSDLISVAKPWHPSVTIMNDSDRYHANNERTVYDFRDIQNHVESGWMSQQFAVGVSDNVVGPSAAMTSSIPSRVKWLRHNQSHNAHVVYRFRGYFYEPADVLRRFKVVLGKYQVPANTHPSVANPPQFLLAVDGKPITSKDKPDNLEGEIDLRAGVHRFEIWATGWDCTIGFGRTVNVLANLADPANLADCPDSFFDPDTFPKGILAPRCPRAGITADSDGTAFKVKFAPDSQARIISLVFMGQEGPVPAVNRIGLSDAAGKQILPVAYDFAELGKNNVLEIITGDKVAIRYEDDRFVTKEKSKHERLLSVAFTTAAMQFEFFQMRKGKNGDDVEYYEKLLRYETGKPVVLTINDADMDVSSKPDTVKVTLESKTGNKRQFAAAETGDSTGIFRLTVTPVAGAATDEKQIQVGDGETLTAVYRDTENTDPGVPADRFASLAHASFSVPDMFISDASVYPIDPTNLPPAVALNEGFSTEEQRVWNTRKMTISELRAYESGKGMVQPRWSLTNRLYSTTKPPTNGFQAVLGRRLYIDVEAAHLALRVGSGVQVFAQTEAGRKLAAQGQPAGDAAEPGAKPPVFDINVPGTISLAAGIYFGAWPPPRYDTPQIPIYEESYQERDVKLTYSRFVCSVALVPGVIPEHGVLSEEEIEQRRTARTLTVQNGLIVKPGDTVHIGFRYADRDGSDKWLTGSAKITSHPVLDVMETDYRNAMTSAYVGEVLAMRVVDLGADLTDRSDTIKVNIKARSGASHSVELNEVDTHTGVFKGLCPLSYVKAGVNVQTNSEYNVKAEGFPVVYGDSVGLRYTDAKRQATDTLLVSVCKGADGMIEPFSKRFEDPDMAARTHFALAESSLEIAKAYRASGDTAKADREYAVAKQMLAGTMDTFRDPETRSQAEYLLGNLTMEEAETVKKPEMQEELYRAALSRYMNVISSYPDTLHASKAQFKIATVYEKLKEPDIAAQEYVKLAYKYPDSEYLAIAMARVGTHFQRKADEYEKKAKPLLEKTDSKDAQFEGAAIQKMAVAEYLKAAKIFDRMQERFPDHDMAGKCGLRAGQAYMRAGDNRRAVNILNRVVKNDSYDGPEVRAQALYWAGMSYEGLGEAMAAYSSYKRLTYDFPESTWASYARAQLSQDRLMNLENDLELKRMEEGR